MADSIADFLTSKPELRGKKIPVGFAFSYPMVRLWTKISSVLISRYQQVQQAIDVGILVTWTKSYDLPDAIGKNAVQLLKDAIKKRGVSIVSSSSSSFEKILLLLREFFSRLQLEKIHHFRNTFILIWVLLSSAFHSLPLFPFLLPSFYHNSNFTQKLFLLTLFTI